MGLHEAQSEIWTSLANHTTQLEKMRTSSCPLARISVYQRIHGDFLTSFFVYVVCSQICFSDSLQYISCFSLLLYHSTTRPLSFVAHVYENERACLHAMSSGYPDSTQRADGTDPH